MFTGYQDELKKQKAAQEISVLCTRIREDAVYMKGERERRIARSNDIGDKDSSEDEIEEFLGNPSTACVRTVIHHNNRHEQQEYAVRHSGPGNNWAEFGIETRYFQPFLRHIAAGTRF